MISHNIIETIEQHARLHGEQPALRGENCSLTYASLYAHIQAQQHTWQHLEQSEPVIALAAENHPAWVVLDLAALASNITLIPLPFFFSSEQWLHAIQKAGVNIIITDQPACFTALLQARITSQVELVVANKRLTQLILQPYSKVALPTNTQKITFTSGTTGNPKGVCLSINNMLNVAASIAEATKLTNHDVHLNVLPLATLLENIAGVYAPLLVGACCILLPSAEIGLNGATGLDIEKLLAALTHSEASTAIFTPELLAALVQHLDAGHARPSKLRFLAVGGASVSPALLTRAQQLSIPVYEGYGLSECASVVTLNTPSLNKIGTVGKVLPHLTISFSDTHEIIVSGNAYLGYIGQLTLPLRQIHTGDIGYIDADGYLIISGRKKNIFITSFGRNVSPEWVERELTSSPYIAQAALFGEAKPWNTAIIVPSNNSTTEQINMAIVSANNQLPDYARITQWLYAEAPFTRNNQQLTANGRNRRDLIWQNYQHQINALYENVPYESQKP